MAVKSVRRKTIKPAIAGSQRLASALLSPQTNPQAKRIFNQSLKRWKADEKPTSFVRDRVMHPAYQRIIGLGPQAIPLILQSLERESDFWFWALEAITGENPIPKSDYGRVPKMVDAWLQWGRRRGYLS